MQFSGDCAHVIYWNLGWTIKMWIKRNWYNMSIEASYSVRAQEVTKCEIMLILAEPDQINAVLLSHGVFNLRRRGPESKLGRPQSSVHLWVHLKSWTRAHFLCTDEVWKQPCMQNRHAQTVSETSVSKQGSAQLEHSTDPHVQAKTWLHGVDVEVG